MVDAANNIDSAVEVETVDGFIAEYFKVTRDGWIVTVDGTEYGLRRERSYDNGEILWTVLELNADHSTAHHYGTVKYRSHTPDTNLALFAYRARLARLDVERETWQSDDETIGV